MKLAFDKYKGIHPGLILEHELKKRGIAKRQFALSVEEHPQTFNAIIKGKRKLTSELAFKIDEALKLKLGTMVVMQTHYEIAEHKRKQNELSKPIFINTLRQGLFWDTDIKRIDWNKQANAIIRRVFERGNDKEKEVIKDHYGTGIIKKALTFYGGGEGIPKTPEKTGVLRIPKNPMFYGGSIAKNTTVKSLKDISGLQWHVRKESEEDDKLNNNSLIIFSAKNSRQLEGKNKRYSAFEGNELSKSIKKHKTKK